MCAASQLPGRGPTDVNVALLPNQKSDDDDDDYEPLNIFLVTPRKHMSWVLIRNASARHFL